MWFFMCIDTHITLYLCIMWYTQSETSPIGIYEIGYTRIIGIMRTTTPKCLFNVMVRGIRFTRFFVQIDPISCYCYMYIIFDLCTSIMIYFYFALYLSIYIFVDMCILYSYPRTYQTYQIILYYIFYHHIIISISFCCVFSVPFTMFVGFYLYTYTNMRKH